MKFDADVLKKYLSGSFSLNDKIRVDEFFDDIHYASGLNETLKEFWDETISKPPPNAQNLDPILDRINHHILLDLNKQSRMKKLWHLYSRVAAILLLPVLLFTLYYFSSNNIILNGAWVEVHSPLGARTQFSLPDGTIGWLNGGSVIKYPVRFGAKRNVTLSGEAYFDVARNPNSPFVIDANKIKVKVLGTAFDVISYKNDSIAEVIVARGKVEVTAKDHKLKEILLPSDRLALNTVSNTYIKSTVNVLDYISWKSGKLIFMNDRFDEVIRKLSRFYNVDFEVNDNVNKNQLFRAVLENENLDEILRYMKLTMGIDYTIQERKIDQDGHLSKRKVIITKAK
ncbi:FecR family protein [Prolixibacter sp. NT017]|uniref:FecR family protein n=1 Tax=Prolixibacter sp. NT017 TaxID=2652390 RepID=UPI001284AD98|nr:FecR family protein [Prolixibacter sp. NT017]GET25601.1 anti-sigma factor [Prolixibacter sp. NT017]